MCKVNYVVGSIAISIPPVNRDRLTTNGMTSFSSLEGTECNRHIDGLKEVITEVNSEDQLEKKL